MEWVAIALGAALVSFFGLGIRVRRQIRQFNADNTRALAAVSRGELATAHDVFLDWSKRETAPQIRAIALHNLAWTLMRQGYLLRAAEIWAENEKRHRRVLEQNFLSATSAIDLALCHALRGALDDAQKWLAEADKRSATAQNPMNGAMLAFARAVLDCRSDRHEDAARLLEESWAEYENVLTGDNSRPLRVVRAFAISASGPRNAGVAQNTLALSRPGFPGEYDFLGASWPEMASFLATNGLTTRT